MPYHQSLERLRYGMKFLPMIASWRKEEPEDAVPAVLINEISRYELIVPYLSPKKLLLSIHSLPVAVFPHLLSPKQPSYSAIEMSLTFFHARYAEGILKTKNVDSTRSAISSLLEKYRAAGDAKNLVHVVQAMPEGTPIFTPNTRLAAEFDELAPKPGEKVIAKQYSGSFADTDLDEYLGSLGDKG
jgi:hypothetical protein